jgi:hypothetical protein
MNYESHIAAEAAHLIRMAKDPGWRDYAKDKAEKMARWQPALYGNFPQLVAEAIKEKASDPSNDPS